MGSYKERGIGILRQFWEVYWLLIGRLIENLFVYCKISGNAYVTSICRDSWLCIVRRGVKVKSICFGTLILFTGKCIIDYRRVWVHSKATYETLYGYSSMGVFHIFLNCTNCAATLLKVTLLHGCFPRFLNCKNGSHFLIIQMVSNRAKHHIFV